MRRKVGAPQPHRGSPLTVRPHSHRYREIHSANKLSKLESRFFPRASSEALGTLTLGLDEPLQGLSPLGLQTSGTMGSLLGASSRTSLTTGTEKEVPIFIHPTGKWSDTGFLIT